MFKNTKKKHIVLYCSYAFPMLSYEFIIISYEFRIIESFFMVNGIRRSVNPRDRPSCDACGFRESMGPVNPESVDPWDPWGL